MRVRYTTEIACARWLTLQRKCYRFCPREAGNLCNLVTSPMPFTTREIESPDPVTRVVAGGRGAAAHRR